MGAGEDDFSGLEGNAKFAQRIGQPGDGIGRRTLHGGADAGGEQLAVLFQHHAGQGDVELARVALGLAEHVDAAGGVVGDGVLDLDLPVGDARIDDLEAGHHVVGGADHVHGGDAGADQIRLEHEGQFGLGLGLDQGGQIDGVAVLIHHAGSQLAEVRLEHAEEVLDRLAGDADLLADDGFAGGHPPVDEAPLDPVGVVEGDVGLALEQGRNRHAGEPGGVELVAVMLDLFGGHDQSLMQTFLRSV